MKICSKCKQEKPLDAFSWRKDQNRPRAQCKECHRTAEARRKSTPSYRAWERKYQQEYRRKNAVRLKEYRTAWLAANPEKRREYEANASPKAKANAAEYIRQRKAEQWEVLDAYKRDQGCTDCGTSEGVLDFDHRDGEPKRWAVSKATGCTWDALWAEIAKCDVRCRPCHSRRHAEAGDTTWRAAA